MSTYTKIFEKNRYNAKDAVLKSRAWFQQQVTLMNKQQIQPMSLIKSSPDKNTMGVKPGELYLFMYDPKTQDSLPYWDQFPLVFPFRKLKDGFIGLNMHYLPYALRIRLLDRLMEYKTNSKYDETTRLKLSWGLIQSASRLKIAEPCVHRYLTSHLKSPMKRIDSAHWATAMMLPVERFVGSSRQKVWARTSKWLN